MKKLTPDLDALAVDSFQAVPRVPQARGTVDGHILHAQVRGHRRGELVLVHRAALPLTI